MVNQNVSTLLWGHSCEYIFGRHADILFFPALLRDRNMIDNAAVVKIYEGSNYTEKPTAREHKRH